jgi:hypothetical protein
MIAAVTLANLNLASDQIDKLKTVPYPQLLAAGEAALKSVAQQTGTPRLGWNVYTDDQYITRLVSRHSRDERQRLQRVQGQPGKRGQQKRLEPAGD